MVGRSPWTAADALVGFRDGVSRTRGSGADEGVRPTWIFDSGHWEPLWK
jgi:hypothetical protein